MMLDPHVLAVITMMGAITFTCRIGGYLAMRWIRSGGFVERWLSELPGAVVIAILAPVLSTGDWGERVALLVVAGLAWARVGTMAAVAGGMATAVAARALT